MTPRIFTNLLSPFICCHHFHVKAWYEKPEPNQDSTPPKGNVNPAHFFRVGGRDGNSPQGDSSTCIEIPINEDAWSNFLHAYQILEGTWLEACNGTNRCNEVYWSTPRVNKPRQTANSRGEKSFTGSSVRLLGLQFHKRWGPALNHFRFMIIFITTCFSIHECSDVPARLHDLPSGNSRLVEGILLTAISP